MGYWAFNLLEEDLATTKERAIAQFGENSKNMEWFNKLATIWLEVLRENQHHIVLQSIFHQYQRDLENQQETSYDFSLIIDRFEAFKREFTNLFGNEYKSLIATLKILTVDRMKEDADTLDNRLQEFITGRPMNLIRGDIRTAEYRMHLCLANLSRGFQEEIQMIWYDNLIAALEELKPYWMRLMIEMNVALGGEDGGSQY